MSMYSKIPPSLFNHPNITILMAAWIRFASHRIKRATAMKTIKKDKMGNHCLPALKNSCNHPVTIKESFMAAATPIIMAMKENIATIKPRLTPLMMASASKITKTMSNIIARQFIF